MTEIDIVFNLHDNTCTHKITQGTYNQNRVNIIFSSEEKKTYFQDLKFGYEVKQESEFIQSDEFPKNNTKYSCCDDSSLVSFDIFSLPETNYQIKVWAHDTGDVVESTIEFTTSRPPQPYPSWTWKEKQWVPPIPQPEDIPRMWNEESQSWVSIIY